jgi:hypothetical protein
MVDLMACKLISLHLDPISDKRHIHNDHDKAPPRTSQSPVEKARAILPAPAPPPDNKVNPSKAMAHTIQTAEGTDCPLSREMTGGNILTKIIHVALVY